MSPSTIAPSPRQTWPSLRAPALILLALAACGPSPTEPVSPAVTASSRAACPPFQAQPAVAERPLLLVQHGHAQAVQKMVLSEDGRILVTMSYDGLLLVWDTTTGLLLRRIRTQGMPFHVALSGNGEKLAYATSDTDQSFAIRTFLVDLARGTPPRDAADWGPIALSPDGKRLVIGGADLTVIDTETLAEVRSIDLHLAGGKALVIGFDRSGKRLGVAGIGEVCVVDVEAGTVLLRRPRSTAPTAAPVKLDLTGDTMVVRVPPATVEIFAVGTGGQGASAPPVILSNPVRESAAGGDRAWILGDLDKFGPPGAVRFGQRLTVRDPSGGVLFEDEMPSFASGLAVSADGAIVAIARDDPGGEGLRTITLRDGATLRPLRTLDIFASGINAVSAPPGRAEVLTRNAQGRLARWDLDRGMLLPRTAGDDIYTPAPIDFDGAGDLLISAGPDSVVRIRPASGGAQLRQWEPDRNHPVVFGRFAGPGRALVTVSSTGSVSRWDLAPEAAPPPRPLHHYAEWNRPAGKEIAALGKPTFKAAISPDGSALAYDGDKGALGVIDTKAGALRWEIAAPSFAAEIGRNRWISFSADGKKVLLSARDGGWGAKNAVLKVFDAATGALADTLHPGTLGPIAVRAGIVAVGGLHPALLDPQSFAVRARIDALDTEVTALSVHPSRDLLLVGGSGGETAIASATTGAPLALFLTAGGADFISTTPEGAFVASTDGARALAWTFTSPLEAYAFDQFATVYDRPEAVRRRLAGEAPDLAAPLLRPPRLALSDAPPSRVAARAIHVHADARSQGRVDALRVFVNGRAAIDRAVCAPEASVDLDIPLLLGQNRVSMVGYDAAGFAGTPAKLSVISTDPEAPRPALWAVSVGVSRYPKLAAEHQLEFATADAKAITAALAAQAGPGKPFAAFHDATLLDRQATVNGVVQAIEGLSAMGPDDLAVVFFAGHGVQLPSDAPGTPKKMVFLTTDAALSTASARENGVGWDRIEGALGKARGRVLMLLDACHSGHVSTELIAPNEALAQRLAGSGRAGVLVFTAARGSEYSYEVPASGKATGGSRGLDLAWDGKAPPADKAPGGGGHGLFTGAVLEALGGSAPDRDHSGAVEVGELIDFVTERVRAASNGKQTPWVARREMFGDFVVAPSGGPSSP
ncbi:MAG: caspase family protein [Byssovorax sp.]